MKKLFMLLNTVSFVFCSTANGSALDSYSDMNAALPAVSVPQVEVRRDTSSTTDAGKYFAKKAFIPVNLSGVTTGIEIPFSPAHIAKLNDMDLFLQQRTPGVPHKDDVTWKRNHLCTDLFALVYDTTDDQAKVLDGTILANKESDNEYTFAIRAGNLGITGYKTADFVSSSVRPVEIAAMGTNAVNYEIIDSGVLNPVTDRQGTHGDRLALDTVKTNPHLFFNLIRRTAHREDLKIISMGIRYTSSYDACIPCFEKIFEASSS